MRRLDRYILGSMIRTIAATAVLVTLVLLLFDIFSNLDRYISRQVGNGMIARLTLLYAPKALILALGPSALFATTYFLSMLHANNEMIILYNTGVSFRRIIMPVLTLGIVLALFQFAFNERVAIPCSREKAALTSEVFGVRETGDNRDVTVRSAEGRYVLHAGRYYESGQRIASVVLVVLDSEGRICSRVDATSGYYNGRYWVLRDATSYLIDPKGNALFVSHEDEYRNESITMEPALMRNLSADITTMELGSAIRYVRRLKTINAVQHTVYATDLASRIFTSLTPLILMVISCSTVFAWKKNVLMLSILTSLAIAVVYYVMQMLGMILAKQGIVAPALGPLGPMVILISLSAVSLAVRRM